MEKMIFILLVSMVAVSSAAVSDTLKVTNGGDLGTWGKPQYCDSNTYAIGYDMKIEAWQIFGDDTALNGIKLICQSPGGSNTNVNTATSKVGPWGRWVGEVRCDSNTDTQGFLTSFRLKVEQPLSGDDTSANYVQFKCRDIKGSMPSYQISKTHPGYGRWGTYGSWSSECRTGTAVCGIKTRIEKVQGSSDDTALNDVMFYCCN